MSTGNPSASWGAEEGTADPRGRRQALTNATPPGGQERWPGEATGDSGQRAGCFHAETRTPHQAERPGSVRHTTPGLLSASELSPASSLDTHTPRGPQTRRALGAEAVASEAGHGPVSSLEPENLGAKGEAAVFLFAESDFAKNGPNGSFVSLHVYQAQLGVPRPAFPRPQGAPLIHKDPPPGQAGH